MNATISFDPDVKALYLQFSKAEIEETVELAKGVLLDVDRNGEAVGLEILNADASLLSSLPAESDAVSLASFLRARAA